MRSLLLALLSALGLYGIAMGSEASGRNESTAVVQLTQSPDDSVNERDSLSALRWADSVFNKLTPRERIAQLFVPRLDIVDNAAGYAVLDKMLSTVGVGGILLGKGTVESYSNLNDYANRISKVPVMVTLDGEWGLSMRVKDAPRFPHNIALGAIRDAGLLEEYGREMARECKLMGVDVNFAPVLDVNSNPDNPVIGYRSFGENSRVVSTHGSAYGRGLERGGVMSVGKHFPGHGDTSTDSHKELARVNHSREYLDSVDLVPFQCCIDDGMSGMMVGHLIVPAIDKSLMPASLSRPITTNLLKKDMGFNGLVFTDALVMKGARGRDGENVCVSALKAGADVLLSSKSPADDIIAIEKAISNGSLDDDAVARSVKKMLFYKYLFCKEPYHKPAGVKALKDSLYSADCRNLIDRLSKGAVTILKNDSSLLPVSGLESNSIAVVELGADASAKEFREMCSRYASGDSYLVNDVMTELLYDKIAEHDVIVVAVYNDKRSTVANFKQLSGLQGFIPVFFINPFKVRAFGDVSRNSTLVMCYDNIPELRGAGAEAIFGGIDVNGVMPVTIDGVGEAGDGLCVAKSRLGFRVDSNRALKLKVDSIVGECIKERAFPGCQVVVVKDGNVILNGAYGTLDYKPGSMKVTDSTLYDIASMSKAVATLPAVMKAWEEGLVDIDSSIADYIPELLGTEKESVTVRELLTHESGLPATLLRLYGTIIDDDSYEGKLFSYKKRSPYTIPLTDNYFANSTARLRGDLFYRGLTAEDDDMLPVAKGLWARSSTPDTIMSAIYKTRLREKKYLYSCLNFCLLSDIVQRTTGVPLDQWVETEITSKVGANNSMFNPSEQRDLSNVAPTENVRFIRGQHIKGYVHDELAAFSGGVQGNAGLFSTALDVAKICQMILNGGYYGGTSVLAPETVSLFTTYKSPTCERGLGFDLLSGLKSMNGTGAPEGVYGHTGFTGTCFWIDPDNNLVFVFLSNRINPSRKNPAFSKLNPRREILKAVYDCAVNP